MKNTGVVRRIDDLGRIVIPKEIRKTLRIKDGESLEIFLNSDNIVLKKYSPLEGLQNFYKMYAESIYSEIGYNIMVVDRDRIVAVAGDFKKKYLDKPISSTIDLIIQNRTVVSSKENAKISIVPGDSLDASYVIAPIITSGDAVGAAIIISSEDKVDDFVIKTGIIAAKFLGKYIEWLLFLYKLVKISVNLNGLCFFLLIFFFFCFLIENAVKNNRRGEKNAYWYKSSS